MSKAQIEIDLPDGQELVEIEQHGDTISSGDGNGVIGHVFFTAITRKAWQWPSWLLYDWLAENANGTIALGYGEPLMVKSKWVVKVADNDMAPFRFSYVYRNDYNFNLPPSTDWTKSLRLNPNRRSTS